MPGKIARRFYRQKIRLGWKKNPWLHAQTIWLVPKFEARFISACRYAGVRVETFPPEALNTLRWRWVLTRLDHDEPEIWQRALNDARKKAALIGPPPDGWVWRPPSDTPPDLTGNTVKIVAHAATAFDKRKQSKIVERSMKWRAHRLRAKIAAADA
jgi:hypothetical protein